MLGAGIVGIWASPLTRAVGLGVGCFLGAELGQLLSLNTADRSFATFWPPAGLLLAALVLTPYRSWPGVLAAAGVATLASNALHDKPLPVNLGFCVANGAEACAGAWLVRRFVGRPVTLTRIEDVLGLTFWAALVGTTVGATLGAGVAHLAFDVPYWSAWRVWWGADALGVAVVAPVVFTWATRAAHPDARPRRVAEVVAVFLGLVAAAEGVYGGWLPRTVAVPVFVLPFLLWTGWRFGPRGAATAVLLVGMIGIWHTSQGRGPYTVLSEDPREQMMRGQVALFVISLCVMALAAIVAERNRAERQRLRLIGELEQALAEIRTLRGLIPICAWCKKIRDDQGLWQRLEDYLCAHTEAMLTHGICPVCIEVQTGGEVTTGAANGRG